MEDAPGARRRRSTWKTPGGGWQNAAAIKFMGPASYRKHPPKPTRSQRISTIQKWKLPGKDSERNDGLTARPSPPAIPFIGI